MSLIPTQANYSAMAGATMSVPHRSLTATTALTTSVVSAVGHGHRKPGPHSATHSGFSVLKMRTNAASGSFAWSTVWGMLPHTRTTPIPQINAQELHAVPAGAVLKIATGHFTQVFPAQRRRTVPQQLLRQLQHSGDHSQLLTQLLLHSSSHRPSQHHQQQQPLLLQQSGQCPQITPYRL